MCGKGSPDSRGRLSPPQVEPRAAAPNVGRAGGGCLHVGRAGAGCPHASRAGGGCLHVGVATEPMADLATRIELQQGRALTPDEIFEITRAREKALSRLLMAFISSGLAFMLLPGTFLGVWNLISITDRRSAASVPPAWIQAHGHAQIFGWIGSFILGIGFYSIPKLRRAAQPFALWTGWLCWELWTTAVGLRWAANVYLWHWRALLPATAAVEVITFLVFLRAVSGHKAKHSGKEKLDAWIWVVIVASLGFLGDLLVNRAGPMLVAIRGGGP